MDLTQAIGSGWLQWLGGCLAILASIVGLDGLADIIPDMSRGAVNRLGWTIRPDVCFQVCQLIESAFLPQLIHVGEKLILTPGLFAVAWLIFIPTHTGGNWHQG